jgi:small redox-active disulfide protein 2
MEIKVLGPGCRDCVPLESRTRQALDTLGITAVVEKIIDPAAIVGYGAMATPGVVVDDHPVVSGRIPSVRRLTELLDR